MRYVKICVAEDGTSYFSDEAWEMREGDFTPPSPAGYMVSDMMRAEGTLMMHHPAGYRDDWHRAPAPVLGTVLRGNVQVFTSDGDTKTLVPGDQFLAADLRGDGHKMEGVDTQTYDLMLVVLEGIPNAPAGE